MSKLYSPGVNGDEAMEEMLRGRALLDDILAGTDENSKYSVEDGGGFVLPLRNTTRCSREWRSQVDSGKVKVHVSSGKGRAIHGEQQQKNSDFLFLLVLFTLWRGCWLFLG